MADNWPHPVLAGGPFDLTPQQLVIPSNQLGAFDGAAIDLVSPVGTYGAVQCVGSFLEGPTWTGVIEQSADQLQWDSIPGAAFPAVTEGSQVASVSFEPTERYVRYSGSVVGGAPDLHLCVVLAKAIARG